jgi:hypothetical protein
MEAIWVPAGAGGVYAHSPLALYAMDEPSGATNDADTTPTRFPPK